jgi:hypothetical protein
MIEVQFKIDDLHVDAGVSQKSSTTESKSSANFYLARNAAVGPASDTKFLNTEWITITIVLIDGFESFEFNFI